MYAAEIFDTHKAILYLKNKGINEEHAEGIVEVYKLAQGDLATKADLELAVNKLEHKIENVETKLENKIDKLEVEVRANFAWIRIVNTGILIAVLAPYLPSLIQLMK